MPHGARFQSKKKKTPPPQLSADAYSDSTGLSSFPWPRAHSDFPEAWCLMELGRLEILCLACLLPAGTVAFQLPVGSLQKTSHPVLSLTYPAQTDAGRPRWAQKLMFVASMT